MPAEQTSLQVEGTASDELMQERLTNLLNDPDFDRLELGIRLPNFFSILGVARKEIQHSHFLAWLLDPYGSHGVGDLFLRRILRDFLLDKKVAEYTQFDADLFALHEVEIRREWSRIDILVLHSEFVVLIENKIDSQDHSEQLRRYREIAERAFPDRKRIYVYMTPNGVDPQDMESGQEYVTYSYGQLCAMLETVLDVYKEKISPSVLHYLHDYLSIVRREIMSTDKLNELAAKLYRAHREALDFIIENRPDAAAELRKYFERKVLDEGWLLGSENKGYVRFLTQKLREVLPEGRSTGWPKKEAFLFELVYYWDNRDVIFNTAIAPGDDQLRTVLREALETLHGQKGYKKPTGKQWLVHFKRRFAFVTSDMAEQPPETVASVIDGFWPDVVDLVKNVERAILARSDDLRKLK